LEETIKNDMSEIQGEFNAPKLKSYQS